MGRLLTELSTEIFKPHRFHRIDVHTFAIEPNLVANISWTRWPNTGTRWIALVLSCVHIATKMRARQAEARHTRTYALLATDSHNEHARGKLKRHPLTVRLRIKLSLKYRLQADSVHLASDQTEAVFFSSVTRLYCYVCLALACLARIFVLMWTQLYAAMFGCYVTILRPTVHTCSRRRSVAPLCFKCGPAFTNFSDFVLQENV